MALLLGAFLSYGVNVGPLLITQHPDIFWGVVASMYIGNIMLIVLNLPFVGLWVKILKIPYHYLVPAILIFCVIGSYSLSNSIVDVIVMIVFGFIGYLFKKLKYEAAPLIMAMVLSPLMENNFRQSLLLSQGDFMIFFSRPLSAILMCIAVLLLILPNLSWVRKRREKRLEASLE
jgi:putative tricarboxylic transport membrane protein